MLELKQDFINKRILITGANGYIGSHLKEALLSCGAIVSTLDRVPSNDKRIAMEHIGNLKDRTFVEHAVLQSDPEIVFHMAALKKRTLSIDDFYSSIQINLIGTLNLLSASGRLRNLNALVVMGTAEEYGVNDPPFSENMREFPVSAYSFSKMCMTHLCEILHTANNLPFVVLRPTLAYGPGQPTDMFLPALIKSVINNKPFPMSPGKQTRDYIYIDDLIEAVIRSSVRKEARGSIINIGSGQSIPIGEIALMAERMLDKENLVKIGQINYREGEIMDYSVNINKAKEILSWSPRTSMGKGLKSTIDYYVQNNEL